MKRRQVALGWVCLMLLGLAAGGLQTAAASISLDANSNIQIVTRGSFDNAAPALIDLLEKYLKLSLNRESLQGEGDKVLFVIESQAAQWFDLDADAISDITQIDQFTIHITPATARDPATIHITGHTAMAAGFGITRFLEQFIGVHWVMPGDMGLVLPKADRFDLPETHIVCKPAFINRIYTGMQFKDPAYIARYEETGLVHDKRMYFHGYDYFRSLRLRHFGHASHALLGLFPPEQYGDSDPDIYPMVNGKRWIPPADKNDRLHQAWHLCYTNPKVVDLATAKALAFFKEKKSAIFSLGINDGTRQVCQCESCKAAGFPKAYFDFVNQVARRVKAVYPAPYTIGVLAYGDVAIPPDDLKLEDNVLVLTSAGEDGHAIAQWGRHVNHLMVYEYLYGWGYWVPNLRLDAMSHNAGIYRRANVKGLHAEVHPIWAFDGPKVAIRSRLMWDPDLDVNAALKEYCQAAFGKGGPAMVRFYRRWADKHDAPSDADVVAPMCDFAEFRHSNKQFASVTAEDYTFCAQRLAEARRSADDPRVQARLEMVQCMFDMSRTLFEIWRLKEQVFTVTETNGQKQLASMLALRQRRESLFDRMRAHPQWFAGTLQTPERILGPMWEGRWEWMLDYEMDAAIRTSAIETTEQTPDQFDALDLPKPYQHIKAISSRTSLPLRNLHLYHRQYNAEKYTAMNVNLHDKIVTFNAAGSGLRKQYLRGVVAIEQDRQYEIQVEFTGRAGTSILRVQNQNVCGKTAQTTEIFDKTTRTVRKRIIVEPVPSWGSYGQSVNELDIELLWMPDSENSQFGGEASFSQLIFRQRSATTPDPPPVKVVQAAAKVNADMPILVAHDGVTTGRETYKVTHAAMLLSDYLSRVQGRKVLITNSESKPGQVKFLITDASRAPAEVAKLLEDKRGDAFVIKYPYELHGESVCLMVSRDTHGYDYPVYYFLRRYAGVHWIGPGEIGQIVPSNPDWTMPEKIDVLENPDFEMRYWADWTFDHARPLMAGSPRMDFHHAFGKIYAPSKYAGSDPDIYPLIDGKRRVPNPEHEATAGWQPCVGNPKTQDIAVKYVIDAYRKDPSTVSVSLSVNDGAAGDCMCDRCRAMDAEDAFADPLNPNLSDRYFRFYNLVIERVLKEVPRARVAVLAYNQTAQPPHDTRINKHVVVFISTAADPGQFAQTGASSSIYQYQLDNAYPTIRHYPHMLADFIRELRDAGGIGYYSQIEHCWAAGGPKTYVLAHLLWDADSDVDALLDQYMRLAFGDQAGRCMRTYFDRWEQVWRREAAELANRYNTIAGWNGDHINKFRHLTWDDVQVFDDAIRDARKAALSEAQRARLDLFDTYYQWIRTSIVQYLTANDMRQDGWLNTRSPDQILDTLKQTLALTDEFNRMWEQRIAVDRTGWLLNQKPGVIKAVERGERFYDSLSVGPIRAELESHLDESMEKAVHYLSDRVGKSPNDDAAVAYWQRQLPQHPELNEYIYPEIARLQGKASGNLLVNGDFEQGLAGGAEPGQYPQLPGWWFYDQVGGVIGSKALYQWSDQQTRNGSKSLGCGAGKYPGLRQFVKLDPGRYRLNFWYRTVERENSVEVSLYLLDEKVKMIDLQTPQAIRNLRNDQYIKFHRRTWPHTAGKWKQARLTFKIEHPRVMAVVLEPFFMEPGQWVWFDDVEVTKLW